MVEGFENRGTGKIVTTLLTAAAGARTLEHYYLINHTVLYANYRRLRCLASKGASFEDLL